MLVKEKLQVDMPDTETKPHVMRVGWSVDSSPLALGEAPLSYGYGGTGRSSCNNKFNHYGESYSTDDVITCYIDLDAVPKAIFFAKNGKYLDVAFRLDRTSDGRVFYPHISVKNMRFDVNFGAFNPYFTPVEGFYFIQCLPQLLRLPPPPPRNRQECEVLMMIGLPSSGKTTWLSKYVKDHPEKKYNILGTNDILLKMKVMGLTRKRNYHGRWDALIKQATGILNEMLKLAKHKNRNYILDQTNVYSSARRRKMGNFYGYHRVAVVVVNENSVLMQRNAEVVRKDGKVVPESAFMEMKSNFALPVQGDSFDEVWYVEENEEKSRYLVKQFNDEGRNWKEEQKKRPNDEVQVKTEPGTDFKKPRHNALPAWSGQARNQYVTQGTAERYPEEVQFQHGPHPPHFSQTGVTVQEIQQNQNAFWQSQQQYSIREKYKQIQPGIHGGQNGGRFPRNPGSNQGSWSEVKQSRNDSPYSQGRQSVQGGSWVYSPEKAGNGFDQHGQVDESPLYQGQARGNPDYQNPANYGNVYARGNPENFSRQPFNQRSTHISFPVKEESYCPDEQPGRYDSFGQVPNTYNNPSQGYLCSSAVSNATPRARSNQQPQGYWGGGQGWGSASQSFNNTNFPLSANQDNANRNQQYYLNRQPQNYQY